MSTAAKLTLALTAVNFAVGLIVPAAVVASGINVEAHPRAVAFTMVGFGILSTYVTARIVL